MGLKYENLDAETRRYMLEEIALDAQNESFYLSSYLSQTGQGDWQEILTEAVVSGTDDSFAITLRQRGRLNQFAQRRRPRGAGYTTYRVPVTAHETLAEGEFNRYFVRGLCRRAIAEGIARLEVYRAKEVEVHAGRHCGRSHHDRVSMIEEAATVPILKREELEWAFP
jgi:hypothetical protein